MAGGAGFEILVGDVAVDGLHQRDSLLPGLGHGHKGGGRLRRRWRGVPVRGGRGGGRLLGTQTRRILGRGGGWNGGRPCRRFRRGGGLERSGRWRRTPAANPDREQEEKRSRGHTMHVANLSRNLLQRKRQCPHDADRCRARGPGRNPASRRQGGALRFPLRDRIPKPCQARLLARPRSDRLPIRRQAGKTVAKMDRITPHPRGGLTAARPRPNLTDFRTPGNLSGADCSRPRVHRQPVSGLPRPLDRTFPPRWPPPRFIGQRVQRSDPVHRGRVAGASRRSLRSIV
jgi:hypothetical protein